MLGTVAPTTRALSAPIVAFRWRHCDLLFQLVSIRCGLRVAEMSLPPPGGQNAGLAREPTIPSAVNEGPRSDASIEKLSKLAPAFDSSGSVTAGNASMISDGGASVVLTSSRFQESHGLKAMARIVSSATAGLAPEDLFVAPVPAIRQALSRAELNVNDIDLFEINEAFAVQALACVRQLELPHSRVNVNGGAIALGHPLGCSGARVVVTLLHAMQQQSARRGVAALCLGGGNAVASVFEAAS